MFIFSLLMYIVCSILLQKSLFRYFSITKLIQTFFLVIFSFNIVLFSLLSMLNLANQAWIALLFQTILCSITCIYLFKRTPISFRSLWSDLQEKIISLKRIDYFLIVLIGTVLAAFFAVGITTPPNNLDSLDPTHLTRVYYAIQQGSLLFDSYHQVARPLNIHIVHFWLFLLGGSENLFFSVQWFSLIVALVTVFKISRLLGFSLTKSLMGAIVVLSFPVVLLQTYSSQGDLTVAALILLSISFALEYSNKKYPPDLFFAAISLIFALGTKNSAFLVLPIFGIYSVVWFFRNKRFRKGNVKIILILSILLLFSGFQFIINIVNKGSFFGSGNILGYNYSSLGNVWEKAKYNLPRYSYQLVGFDGLPVQMQTSLFEKKAIVFSKGLSIFGIDLEDDVFLAPGFSQIESFQYNKLNDLNEDSSWFGPLGFLIPLALLLSQLSKNSSRRQFSLFSFLLFTSYLFLVFLQRPGWDPYQGRYFISSVLPCVPLVPILIPSRKFLKQSISVILILISFTVVTFSFFTNSSKPVITQRESREYFYNYFIPLPSDNAAQLFIKERVRYGYAYLAESIPKRRNIYSVHYLEQVYFNSLPTVNDVIFINMLIPEDIPITFWFHEKSMEYGLFGQNKRRDLHPVYDLDQSIKGWFVTYSSTFVEVSGQVHLIAEYGNYKVYYFQ